MIGSEKLVKVSNGVDGSKERTVQPTTTLQNQFRYRVRHISLARGRLDILQNPVAVSLGDKLKAENSIFGEIHVGFKQTRSATSVKRFSQKVFLERTLAVLVILQSNVSIGGESSGQDGNETKGRLKRLIENVAHLVLKVLSSNQGVHKVLATSSQHGLDFTTGASAHGFKVKRLPEVVDGVATGASTSVDKDANIGVENATKSLEKPSVRVDLLLVLFFQTKQHLHGLATMDQTDNVVLEGQMRLGGIFVNVRRHVLVVNLLLRNAFLVNTQARHDGFGARVDLGTTVANNAHDNFLPGILAPGLAVWSVAHVFDVFVNTDHGAGKEDIIFVVHGDYNEELGMTGLAEQFLAQGKILIVKVGRVASRRSVAHVCKLVAFTMRILLQENRGNRAVKNQVAPVKEDLLHSLPPFDTGTIREMRLLWFVSERAFIQATLAKHGSGVIGTIVVLVVAMVAISSRVVVAAVAQRAGSVSWVLLKVVHLFDIVASVRGVAPATVD